MTVVAHEAVVRTRDGAALATEVIRLDDDGRRPALLIRTPYGKPSLRIGEDPIALARSGWVVVLQDVRGRWDSTGDFVPFQQEVDDGADAVAWCTGQPWSDGSVVVVGASYNGLAAWLAARDLPTGLRAIAPVVSAPDTRDPWVRRGGALNLGFLLNWGMGLGILGSAGDPEVKARASRRHSEFRELVRDQRALDHLTEALPRATPWLLDDPGDACPDPLADSELGRRGLAVHQVTGWFDIFVEGAIRAYQALRSTPARDQQRLVIGPWTHGTVYGTAAGDLEFGTEASGFLRFPQERMEFLRAAVAGRPVEAGVSVFVLGSNEWVELESWPPAGPVVRLELEPRRLVPRSSTPAMHLEWWHDAANPVPSRGGRTLHPGTDAAGPMVVPVEGVERADVLDFTSDPLESDVVVAGPVTLAVRAGAGRTAPADLVATVYDVSPQGRAIDVVSGVRRFGPKDGDVGVTVELGNIAYRLPAGHRVRLRLSGSSLPAFDLTASGPRRVLVGQASGATLSLPTLPLPALSPPAPA